MSKARKQMENKIIAVYGNSGSYKTTTALSLTREISHRQPRAKILLISTDTTKPLLPIIAPSAKEMKGSIGRVLSGLDLSEEIIQRNSYDAADNIGVLSYNIRENKNSFAIASPERIDDLYSFCQMFYNYTIIDCTSDILGNSLSAKALINAGRVVELLTCDLNGLVFDGSQEPILQSEQYGYRDYIRLLSLNPSFKQDESSMKQALGRIRGAIPYSTKTAEFFNQGRLLYEKTGDYAYDKVIKDLAAILMEEDEECLAYSSEKCSKGVASKLMDFLAKKK